MEKHNLPTLKEMVELIKIGETKSVEEILNLEFPDSLKIKEATIYRRNNLFDITVCYENGNCSQGLFLTEERLEDFMNEKFEFRYCSVCNRIMTEGWMYSENSEYFCSEECYTKDANDTWGEGNWKMSEEENSEGGYLSYYDKDNDKWEDLDFFWTDWWD